MVWRCCFDFRFRCSRYNGPFFSLSRILPLSSNQILVQYLFILLSSMCPCLMGIEVTLSWTNILHQAFSNIFYSFESSIEQRCSIAMNKKKENGAISWKFIDNDPTSKIDNRSFGKTCFWLQHSSFQSTQFIDILPHKY